MATYQVGSDGKAPKGLKVGDFVVTGGGTYIIDFVNPDGTYKSSLYNGSSTTYNTNKNSYASAPTPSSSSSSSSQWAGQGSNVSHGGQGNLTYNSSTGQFTRTMPNGTSYYVNPGDEKYSSIKSEYATANGYDPTSVGGNVMDTIRDIEIPPAQDNSEMLSYIQALQGQISQLQNQSYAPVDQKAAMADVLSYDEAYQLAKSIVEPQYNSRCPGS